MLLIDDDEAKRREGQKQRGARADDDLLLAARDALEQPVAPARADARMPFGGRDAEPLLETIAELRRQRNFGHQDENLFAATQRFGHGLEINLRLARSGDAFEQRDIERGYARHLDERLRGFTLARVENRRGVIGIRRLRRSGDHRLDQKHAFVDKPVDHRGGHAGRLRERPLRRRQSICERRHHAPPRRRHAPRLRPAGAHRQRDALGMLLRQAHRHARRHAARRQRVVREPFDEAPQPRRHRRNVELSLDRLQIAAAARPVDGPDDADRLRTAERNRDDVSGREREARRNGVGIGGVHRHRR